MRTVYGWSLAILIGSCGIAAAQNRTLPAPAQRPGAAPPAAAAPGGVAAGGAAVNGAATQQGTADQQVAACLWAGNRNEIELAKLAQQKAKHDSVKQFAAEMIKDHNQAADELARVAGNLVNVGTARAGTGADTRREVRRPVLDEAQDRQKGREEAREDRRDARENGAAPADRREGREEARNDRRGGREEAREDRRDDRATVAAGRQQPFNWVTIHREIADECLQSSKQELNDKQANEFDKCYMGMQIAAHMKMVDELKVLKNHVSSQFSQDLEKTLETTEHHLKEAKKIMEEIKDQPDRGGDKKNQ